MENYLNTNLHKFKDIKTIPNYPIVIGTTGHRTYREEEKEILEEEVSKFFNSLFQKYENTPIVLLSALAEGSDRLVASVFLGLCNAHKPGLKLISPLPMQKDEYCKDFRNESSRNEFEHLLKKSEYYFELPYTKGVNVTNINDETYRTKQYAQLGFYIAHNSQIILALWDGNYNELNGGTSYVVNCFLNGIQNEFLINPNPFHNYDTGPVYHIFTNRKNSKTSNSEYDSLSKYINPNISVDSKDVSGFRKVFKKKKDALKSSNELHGYYDNLFKHFDNLNSDIDNYSKYISKKLKVKKNPLLNENKYKVNICLNKLSDYYKILDILAIKFKQKRDFVLKISLIFIVLAVLFFQLYLEFYKTIALLIFYPALLCICIILYYYIKYNEYDKKHEDYRAIAEGIRIQYYWSLYGIPKNVIDYYLHKHRSELLWIRHCIRNITVYTRTEFIAKKNINSTNNNTQLILEEWVEKQSNWLKEKSLFFKKKSKRYELISNVFFIITIISSILLVLVSIFLENDGQYLNISTELIHHTIVVCIGISLAIMGTMKSYPDKMVYSDLSKQYKQMSVIFNIAKEQIHKNSDPQNREKISTILEKLGEEALLENTEWIINHRTHTLELPSG
jgi:hypothetical protein